jgi:adenine-specific DNA-methyltransferase
MGGMQYDLDIPHAIDLSLYEYAERSSGETHGVVLTKPHIVELILDLAGYTSERDLSALRLLEPSCGHGAFLLPALDRLLLSLPPERRNLATLEAAISAFDIDPTHVEITREAIRRRLVLAGLDKSDAQTLASRWVTHGDFLLARLTPSFDVIVGNPPYIRIEQLSRQLLALYRSRFSTLYDRADLYVAFIERALSLLAPKGHLSFICADRWILNRYGAPLRDFISSGFTVQAYIDLHQASPFDSDVIAYPSIFLIGRKDTARPTHVGKLTSASVEECRALVASIIEIESGKPSNTVEVHDTWFSGDAPWVLSNSECRAALRLLENNFPLLEENGAAAVRIGVATGNDRVLIVPSDLAVEPDRLLPLVMREDIVDGRLVDAGRAVINTYETGAGTIDLASYPKLAAYLELHKEALQRRHVAKRPGSAWFKTIDRVHPTHVQKPKLLIPDIAGSNQVAYDDGRFYPHHNLYYVLSDVWDLELLGAILSSRVALFFVWSYAVKMRGGYLRFQAQYLRRIRVPAPGTIPHRLAASLKEAFKRRDFASIDRLALEAYALPSLPDFDFVDTRC